jgi:hypothetical protein
MPRSHALLLALATLSVTAVAQNANSAQSNFLSESDTNGTSYTQQQAAPIERTPSQQTARIQSSEPIQGVWLRSAPESAVQTISANANGTEIRVEHGIANVSVHHPEENTEILVDLPGGQTSLLKDGLYTFNADTNTVRVFQGEANAYVTDHDQDGVKVKEDHQFTFGNGSVHAKDMDRAEARADLLNGGFAGGDRHGDGYPSAYGFYSGYPYWDYGYPYYAWGGPWGWGYPYGYGIGFGYYGGFRGGYFGGFRGGYGGFRGRR